MSTDPELQLQRNEHLHRELLIKALVFIPFIIIVAWDTIKLRLAQTKTGRIPLERESVTRSNATNPERAAGHRPALQPKASSSTSLDCNQTTPPPLVRRQLLETPSTELSGCHQITSQRKQHHDQQH